MAKDKSSFVLYCDIIHTVNKLSDEQAGNLFKHILKYVNDEQPEPENIVTEIAFEPIKQALKRDLRKYEAICERNKINGLNGGRPHKEPKKPSGLFGNPTKPKKADIDIDSDIEIKKEFECFWNLYNKKKGDKEKIFIKWKNIKQDDRDKIFKTLPAFLESISDKQFQPFPETYLNNKRWNDELETTSNPKIAPYRFGSGKVKPN